MCDMAFTISFFFFIIYKIAYRFILINPFLQGTQGGGVITLQRAGNRGGLAFTSSTLTMLWWAATGTGVVFMRSISCIVFVHERSPLN